MSAALNNKVNNQPTAVASAAGTGNLRIAITNILLSVASATTIFLVSLFYYQAAYQWFLAGAVLFGVYSISLLLMYWRHTTVAKTTALLFTNAAAAVVLQQFSNVWQGTALILVLAVSPLLVFNIKKPVLPVLFGLMPFVSLFFVLTGSMPINVQPVPSMLVPVLFWTLFFVAAAGLVSSVLYLIIKSNKVYENNNLKRGLTPQQEDLLNDIYRSTNSAEIIEVAAPQTRNTNVEVKPVAKPTPISQQYSYLQVVILTTDAGTGNAYRSTAAQAGLNATAYTTIDDALKAIDTLKQTVLLVDINATPHQWLNLAHTLYQKGYPDLYILYAFNALPDSAFTRQLEEYGINIFLKPLTANDFEHIALQITPKQSKPAVLPGVGNTPGGTVPELNILVVEDNEVNRTLTARVIEKLGHTVITAENGSDAVDLCQEHAFDIILMDIEMPKMNGVEATHLIRAIDARQLRHTPIIAITGLSTMRNQYLNLGIDDYLAKPYNRKILEEKIYQQYVTYIAPQINTVTPNSQSMENVDNLKVDLTYLENLLQGNNKAIHEVLSMFVSQTPQLLTEMHSAYNQGQIIKLSRLTHKLKGTLVAIGVNGNDMEQIKLLEEKSLKDTDDGQIKPILDKSTDRLMHIIDEMKVYVDDLNH